MYSKNVILSGTCSLPELNLSENIEPKKWVPFHRGIVEGLTPFLLIILRSALSLSKKITEPRLPSSCPPPDRKKWGAGRWKEEAQDPRWAVG